MLKFSSKGFVLLRSEMSSMKNHDAMCALLRRPRVRKTWEKQKKTQTLKK
jgi:hypothetical protein